MPLKGIWDFKPN